jgi:membrane protein implicated in regulation of membrane protease activity
MLGLYIVFGLAGLIVVLASALGGHHGHDADAGADGDVHAGDQGWDAWLPFLSLRFWSYASAGFGMIGALGTAFTNAAPWTVFGAAAGGGVAAGWAVYLLITLARRGEASSSASSADLLGKEARMLVGFGEGQPGKARMQVKGETIDMLAFSDSGAPIPAGEEVIVLSVEGNRVRVTPREEIFPRD